MAVNKDIKFVRSLGQKKFRLESGFFIAEGLKLTTEALASSWTIHSLYSTDPSFAKDHPEAHLVTSREMEMMSQLHTPSAHLVVLQTPTFTLDLAHEPMLCIADGVSDPGNLGTIIRTADWFGIRHLLCTNNCVEWSNPKLVQATMGSLFRVKVHYLSKEDIIAHCKKYNYLLSGAVLHGTEMYDCKLTKKHALIIGSESHGISSDMQAALDQRITIPGVDGAESLNASVAAGILFAEFYRQING
jgi:RNA methyltransferase, TrmH family